MLDNVAVGRIYGRERGSARAARPRPRRSTCSTLVGLGDRPGLLAKSLTLVDRKRLELARALATRPTLLLIDELLAGLNPSEVLRRHGADPPDPSRRASRS